MDNEPKNQQIQVKVSDEVLKGIYANSLMVSHNPEEFVLDFMSIFPNSPAAVIGSRLVLSPGNMKRIVSVLTENVKNYEKSFGEIKAQPAPESGHKMGFRTEE